MTSPKVNESNMQHERTSPRRRVAKLIGSDVELGNMILGIERLNGTGAEASRLLLRHVDGFPTSPSHSYQSEGGGAQSGNGGGYYGAARQTEHEDDGYYHRSQSSQSSYGQRGSSYSGGYYGGYYSGYNPQDWGRKYLSTNGGCVYIDLSHLELCIPEVLSARDYVAASRAMLYIARAAMHAANEQLPEGQRLVVMVNNSDGQSNSYGSHLNFLITRGLWRRLFERLYPDLFVLAAFQASSIVITGAGKVGAENEHEPVDYQISQRADFIETLIAPQTTWHRPLINTRDEALCGPRYHRDREDEITLNDRLARLHCIFYDNTLCHVSSFLKVGMMQVVLAMLEAGYRLPGLILEDPIAALHAWSHDPDLRVRARLGDGGNTVTAVELQRAFLESAKVFVSSEGGLETVPDVELILALWEDTIVKLEARDFDALRTRLDWVLKRSLLERAVQDRPGLDWRSPEIKHLDLLYASLDDADGLYWAIERSGLVQRVVSEGTIERFLHQPPDDTRAWTRAMLLRQAGRAGIDRTDWDEVSVVVGRSRWGWKSTRTVELADPLGFTRVEAEECFEQAESLSELLDALYMVGHSGGAALVPRVT
jgi:proteasome accessory factor A